MHDDLKSFKQKFVPKFCKNLIKFEKPQKFSKTPNVRKKNVWWRDGKEIIPMKMQEKYRRKSEEDEEVEIEVFGRGRDFSINRDRGDMREIRIDPIYKNPQILTDREVSRIKIRENSYQVAIENLLKGVHNKKGSMDRKAIEHLSSMQKLPRWIEKLSISYRDWISRISMDQDCDNRERKLKSSIDSLAVKKLSRLLKIVCQRREKNIDMNAIKHDAQPKIQPTF